MKKLIAGVSLLAAVSVLQATPLFYDSFNYSSGSLVAIDLSKYIVEYKGHRPNECRAVQHPGTY